MFPSIRYLDPVLECAIFLFVLYLFTLLRINDVDESDAKVWSSYDNCCNFNLKMLIWLIVPPAYVLSVPTFLGPTRFVIIVVVLLAAI